MKHHQEYIGRKLALTSRVVRAYADQQMAGAGSSLSVAIIAKIVAATPGLSQRELADQMGVEGPTMARHLDRLEADGIVARTRDTQDRRIGRLSKIAARNHRQLTSVFGTDELTRFEEYLDRINAHANELLHAGEEAMAS
jgi:DNA-binding MarR family transcriptional regulator